MKALLSVLLSLFLFYTIGFGQNSKTIHGYLHNKYTFSPVEGAFVFIQDSSLTTYSDNTGHYSITIPRRTKKLNIQHENYVKEEIRLYRPTRGLNVWMIPLSKKSDRYGKTSGKNVVAWLPTKLIWGALGMRYERFIGMKYSAGLYVDWYYKGKQYFGEEEYTGFKATPTFRYYLKHHEASGLYVQASAILGYFDFSVLNYVDPYDAGDSYSVQDKFWTGGAGFAIGGCFAYGKSRHAYLDMNVGMQIMPANYPNTMQTPKGLYEHYPTWWYVVGPGTIIEIKIALGGIF